MEGAQGNRNGKPFLEGKRYGHTWTRALWKWDTLLILIGFFPKIGGENFARV